MKLLLDTHALLWFSGGDSRISETAKESIADPENDLLLSLASVWEMAIKVSIGKLDLPNEISLFLAEARTNVSFEVLAIEQNHVLEVASLPFHHRDPFDRLLIAQAMLEQVPLVSADEQFDSYGITRHW